MPKLLCTCDETIFLQEIPCKDQWMIIPDAKMHEFYKYEKLTASDVYVEMDVVVKCPHCERLWVFWGGFDKTPFEYVLHAPAND